MQEKNLVGLTVEQCILCIDMFSGCNKETVMITPASNDPNSYFVSDADYKIIGYKTDGIHNALGNWAKYGVMWLMDNRGECYSIENALNHLTESGVDTEALYKAQWADL